MKLQYDLSFDKYLKIDALSASSLKQILKSPTHYKWAIDHKYTSEAMNFGSAYHTRILEPGKFNDIVKVEPEINKRTKAGKEELKLFYEKYKPGKVFITEKEFTTIQFMSKQLHRNEQATKLLKGINSEVTGLFKVPGFDYQGKIRIDALKEDQYLIDLKTTTDVDPGNFSRSCLKYGYHIQAAWYLMGYKAITGVDAEFYFIVQEKKAPNIVAVYKPSQAFLDAGLEKVHKALEIYNTSELFDNWDTYQEVMTINLPIWS